MKFEQVLGLYETAVRSAAGEDHTAAVKTLAGINLNDDQAFEKNRNGRELRKNILIQLAVSHIRLKDDDAAEAALMNLINYKTGIYEAYDLLSLIYEGRNDYNKARVCYEKQVELNPADIKAKLRAAKRSDTCPYEKFIALLDEADGIIAKNAFISQEETYIAGVFCECFEVSVKLFAPERALGYFDTFAAKIAPEKRAAHPLYKDMLKMAYTHSYYTTHYSDDALVDIINQMYELYKPPRENKIKADITRADDLKIALLSSDFRYHPIGRFITALFLDNNKTPGISYYCYDTNEAGEKDAIKRMIKERADKYINIARMNDDEAEQLILKDAPDILIDLNGVSSGAKTELIARRLAPVQITWIGFPCTYAMPNIDYQIADEKTDPIGIAERLYTEKLVYMSYNFLCYPVHINIEENDLLNPTVPYNNNGYTTFGSFSNAIKFSPETLKLWAAVMERVKDSRLIIRSNNGCKDKTSITALKTRFEKYGIDTTRVDFLETSPVFEEYLEFYNEVDIILDTYPFNGATTTCDAVMMGVPVVSRYGPSRHAARAGLSLLSAVGLESLCADTDEMFIDTAVKLSRNISRLGIMRNRLPRLFAGSTLTHTEAFKIEFEELLKRLYIAACN